MDNIKDNYIESYYQALLRAKNKKEILDLLNKLYEDGYQDGSDKN